MSDIDKLRQRMRDRVSPRNSSRWYDIRDQAGDKAVLRIYDEIHWLFGVTPEDLARDLEAITAPEIEVQINSPGGDVFDGIAIFNALRTHPATVTTRVDGLAASIASVIAQAGEQRIMLSGSQMMIHEAWGLSIGPAGEHREMADLLDKQTDVIASIYAERSGRDQADFREMMQAETWLTADEAVDAGLADEVVNPAEVDGGQAQAGQRQQLRDEISEAVGAAKEAVTSAERVAALRAEKGKDLSQANRESLGELRDVAAQLEALLSEHDDGEQPTEPAGDVSDALARELAKLIASSTGATR